MTQQIVNGDIKEAADTIDYVVNMLVTFWEMVPLEMKMYIAVMYSVSALLQTYKVWGLTADSKKQRMLKLRRAATIFAVLLAGVASYIYKGHMHFGWFIFAGLTAAKSVMYAHYFFVEVVAPLIGSIKNWIVKKYMGAVNAK